MFCPKCGTTCDKVDVRMEFVEGNEDRTEVHICPNCKSIWEADQDLGYIMKTTSVAERMHCTECSAITTSADKLVPVKSIHAEEYSIACIHVADSLKFWRKLTPEERKQFDKGTDDLVHALIGPMKRKVVRKG